MVELAMPPESEPLFIVCWALLQYSGSALARRGQVLPRGSG